MILTDFPHPTSHTYHTSTDALEGNLSHGRVQHTVQYPTASKGTENTTQNINEGKSEVVWIDYHPPPKENQNNLFNV